MGSPLEPGDLQTSRAVEQTGPGPNAHGCSILLAEPSPILREKIAGILGRMDQIWCIGQVASAQDLERASAVVRPDLILADLKILDHPGLLPMLRSLRPRIQIVGLVDATSGPYRQRAAAFGLDGICARGELVAEVDRLIEIIESRRSGSDSERQR